MQAVPDLSIIIPCHNEGRLLYEAVHSIVNQTAPDVCSPNIEIIIINDHSRDPETITAIKEACKLAPDIHSYLNKPGKGASAARNFGVQMSRAPWISFLDADDLWTGDSLKLRWNAIQAMGDCENVGWITADFLCMDATGNIDPTPAHFLRPDIQSILEGNEATASGWHLKRPVREFIKASPAWTGCVMCKRSLFVESGGFSEKLENAEDVHLWVRLAALSDLYYLSMPLAIYRERPGSETNQGKPPAIWDMVAHKILLSEQTMAPYQKDIKNRISRAAQTNAYHYRKLGQHSNAFRMATTAIQNQPFRIRSWSELMKSSINYCMKIIHRTRSDASLNGK